MEKKPGKLKIKADSKAHLKAGNYNQGAPKEFTFTDYKEGSYECEVEFDKGKIVNIFIDGKAVPKSDQVLQDKEAQRVKRAQEEAQKKEEERKRRESEKQRPTPRQQDAISAKIPPDSFQSDKTKVPSDVRNILKGQEIENFHLKLNRLARFESVKGDEKFYFFNPKRREERDRNTGQRTMLLDEFEMKARFNETYIQAIAARHQKHVAIFVGQSFESATFTPNWRLIVGLGGESVYETSITLHHIYGFPYIPASSIKGVLRSFMITEKFDNKEGEAIENQAFCDVFGCPAELPGEKDGKKKTYSSYYKEARQGKALFFDAFPTKAPTIKPDVMNPHYPEWYGKGKPPTDTQSPIPVFFLTVVDTSFQFLFGSKKMDINEKFWGDKTLVQWLSDALTQHGIGAKTAVGYGIGELQSP